MVVTAKSSAECWKTRLPTLNRAIDRETEYPCPRYTSSFNILGTTPIFFNDPAPLVNDWIIWVENTEGLSPRMLVGNLNGRNTCAIAELRGNTIFETSQRIFARRTFYDDCEWLTAARSVATTGNGFD